MHFMAIPPRLEGSSMAANTPFGKVYAGGMRRETPRRENTNASRHILRFVASAP
jgi:hypothetical protein